MTVIQQCICQWWCKSIANVHYLGISRRVSQTQASYLLYMHILIFSSTSQTAGLAFGTAASPLDETSPVVSATSRFIPPGCIFQARSPFSCCSDSKCHWLLSSKSPEAFEGTFQSTNDPRAWRATAFHQTRPWVPCTPFMIYIAIRDQRSPSSSGVFASKLVAVWEEVLKG